MTEIHPGMFGNVSGNSGKGSTQSNKKKIALVEVNSDYKRVLMNVSKSRCYEMDEFVSLEGMVEEFKPGRYDAAIIETKGDLLGDLDEYEKIRLKDNGIALLLITKHVPSKVLLQWLTARLGAIGIANSPIEPDDFINKIDQAICYDLFQESKGKDYFNFTDISKRKDSQKKSIEPLLNDSLSPYCANDVVRRSR